jgi:hypothetical protein
VERGDFAGFVALVMVAAAVSAPVAGIKVTGVGLREMGAAVAAAHCVPFAYDDAPYHFTASGQGLILPEGLRNDAAQCQDAIRVRRLIDAAAAPP